MARDRCCLVYLKNKSVTVYDKPGWNLEHLGLAYLATALRRAGYDTTIINAAAESLSLEEVVARVMDLDVFFCGISPTCATIQDALDFAAALKHFVPQLHVCFGGHHATHCAEDILNDQPAVDSVVLGYADAAIVQLANAVRYGESLGSVAGVVCRSGTGGTVTACNPQVDCDLDALPLPHHTESSIRYNSFSIYTSRGCHYSCSFCSTPQFCKIQNLRGLHQRSAQSVVREVEQLCAIGPRGGIPDISILDDNFVSADGVSKKRARDIASLVLEEGLRARFWMMAGVRTFGKQDSALLDLLWQAGFAKILLGIEAGHDDTLRVYNKPASHAINLSTIDLLSRFPFALHITTILFHPYATMGEIRANARFIYSLLERENACLYTAYTSRLMAFPGASIHDRLVHDGLMPAERSYANPYGYTFLSPTVATLARYMQALEPVIAPITWLIADVRNFLTVGIVNPVQARATSCEASVLSRLVRLANERLHQHFMLAADLIERSESNLLALESEKFAADLDKNGKTLQAAYLRLVDPGQTERPGSTALSGNSPPITQRSGVDWVSAIEGLT